ncbi:hypothetical protein ACSBR2_014547 [Camellia fascicularis]
MSSKFTIFFLTQIFSFLFIFLSHGSFTEAQSNAKTTKIGAIIDANSRIGKEQKIGMEIAAQNFNSNTSNTHKLVLHFKDPGRDPLQAVYAVPRLKPTVTDIKFLRRTNAIVGCDGDSFVKHYLVALLGFKENNIKPVDSQYNYPGEFESGNITAAFLEPPYAKIFLRENCNKYTVSGPTY